MSADPNGTFSRSHVQAVIDAIARQVTDPADAPLFATTRALVDIVVWRVVHGQTVEQITQFLADNITPDAASYDDAVLWVVAEAHVRLAKDATEGGTR